MDIFFADDSVQQGVREGMGKLVAFGGVFVNEVALKPLGLAIDEIADQHGIPKGTELKWSPGKENWIHSNLVGDDRTDCYKQVLRVARDHGVRSLVVICDTGRTPRQGQDAFSKCVTYAFERIEMHLKTIDQLGLVVADKPGGGKKQDEALLEDFLDKVQSGTEFVPPKRVALNVLTTPSHLMRHLQVADLVTGITTAMIAGQVKYAEQLINEVKPLFIENYLGYIGGSGVKLIPDRLQNLYYWALGEDTYARTRYMSGYALPRQGLPYYSGGFSEQQL